MTLKIEQVKLKSLEFDAKNARKHSEANLSAIQASLAEFGQRKPIVVDRQGVVVAGNGTMAAAQALGWDTIAAVRVPEDWSEDKIKAFALADNRVAELAEWDEAVVMEQAGELMAAGFKLEDFGFTDADIGVFDVEEVEPPSLEAGGKGDMEQITFTLHTEQAEVVRQAIANAKLNEQIDSELNANGNANAIAFICGWYNDGRV